MGTYDRQIYLPAVLQTGWGADVNANFSRLADLAINVKAYGALGDGSTDDTAAFTSALAAAPGRRLYIPGSANPYLVDGTALTVGNKTTICGDGPGESIVKIKNGVTPG